MSSDREASAESTSVARSVLDGDVWVLGLQGDFDAGTEAIETVQEAVARALEAFDGPLIIDLSLVGFCDSALLNLLIRTARHRRLALTGCGPLVQRLLDVTGLAGHLPQYSSLAQARAAVIAGQPPAASA
ncbi:STAS domain-containing protein [Streptomyces sp. NPDC005385]|uniref:STAS domain-containing protein n=1 Tax=Streptomyces sp. NPDC005385 TaxID=3157039 RepID=UPI0033B2438B